MQDEVSTTKIGFSDFSDNLVIRAPCPFLTPATIIQAGQVRRTELRCCTAFPHVKFVPKVCKQSRAVYLLIEFMFVLQNLNLFEQVVVEFQFITNTRKDFVLYINKCSRRSVETFCRSRKTLDNWQQTANRNHPQPSP